MQKLLILESVDTHIQLIRINHIEKANALDAALCSALINALTDANKNASVKIIILTGTNKFFSAGGDIKAMHEKREMFAGSAIEIEQKYIQSIQQLQKTIFNLNTPIIAAVNGVASGAGNDLVAFCDIAIASKKARFAESFINLGLISGDGGYWIQPRLLGKSNALLMAYTGDLFSAEDALSMGLVSKVVEHDQLMEETINLARKIARKPLLALQHTRRLVLDGMQVSFTESLAKSARIQSQLHHSDDHNEAVKNLLAKLKK